MVNQPFQAQLRAVGKAAVIDLAGDIDAFADSSMSEIYDQAAASGSPILLNFTRVGYINSTGIALIVRLLAAARKAGIPVIGYGLSRHYVEIFEITRLADFMNIFPDEQTALVEGAPASS